MDSKRLGAERAMDTLVTQSAAMRGAIAAALRMAQHDRPVFIGGETGTGRKLMARMIHDESGRQSSRYIIVRSDALSVDVLDKTLFGDERAGVLGKLEEADGGTLVLSEIELLNPVAQERLLSVLRQGFYLTAVHDKRRVNCRLLTTGNREELERKASVGQYSPDLVNLLCEQTVEMPSLSERRADIPQLVMETLHELSARERIEPPVVPYHYLELLMNVAWSENVRQLRNHIESVMVLSGGDFDPEIIREHFVPEAAPATIKTAVQTLWLKLRGTVGSPAVAYNRK